MAFARASSDPSCAASYALDPFVRVDYSYDRNANDVGYVLTLAGGATFERRLTRHSYLRGEVTKVTNVCGTETNEIAYAYDALQRPVSRNADMFAYNRRGEVASATVAGEPSAYAYDFIGNATSVTVDGATTTCAANALNQCETVAEPDAMLVQKLLWRCQSEKK